MAQNITIMGASYSDVPAVQLPKTGGGTARFDDASITTATAYIITMTQQPPTTQSIMSILIVW